MANTKKEDQSSALTIPDQGGGEVAIYDRIQNPMEAVQIMGKMFASSGMFGCQKIEQGEVLALACLTEKQSPFEIMKTYHIIGGKLEMKAAAMLAKFKQRGGKWTWKTKIGDRIKAAAYVVSGDGQNEGEEEYTIEDAEAEGLSNKEIWKKSRPDMLRARLIAKVVRAFDPEVNSGVYDSSEFNSDIAEAASQPRTLQRAAKAEPKAPKTTAPKTIAEAVIIASETISEDAIDMTPQEHRLDQIVGAEGVTEEQINSFLISRNYIPEGQTYRSVSDELCNRIIENAEAFLGQVADHAKGGQE